ncbi:N-acyl-D-amino-acid deacylase family protein [Aeromicrobium fastidiosum]|uniref:Amidohydrolase family protein n=1 Tax=Aeromicrobium fastidiosum TaxID=52699 RepID=A0A641AQV6_9ACTN|nr:amidohydrolase family protein [Aeromicrobium fastidiosum]KAA1378472.1 amidohydrolase family protein [Aeromicrobium fastidiosum]MBP2392563.1 N-acyl-D-aspartate/D-glutamate deacylase [Aeromicrobium fastidiosum]
MSERTTVTGGWLIDGTGSPARRADLLIEDDRISAVTQPGDLASTDARTIDVGGLTITPGIIDVHSHADIAFALAGDDVSKILQGVTTEVVGNCGTSLAPLGVAHREVATRIAGPDADLSWTGFGDYLDAVDGGTQVTNSCHLVGHSSLREAVLGHDDRAPDPDELSTMVRLLHDALEAGAFGLSTGLIYPPGAFAEANEVATLVSSLSAHHVYATHMRNESDHLIAALDEAIGSLRDASCRLQVSHLKATGRRNHGTMGIALERLDRARRRGLDVHHDVYPYTAASTGLTACLPPWSLVGGTAEMLSRLTSASVRDRIRHDVLSPSPHDWDNPVAAAGWEGLVIAGTGSGSHEGVSLAALADEWDCDPFGAMVDLLVRELGQVTMVEHSMDQADVDLAVTDRHAIIASDGLPPGSGGSSHPRGHGTFPRALGHLSRDRGLLDLPTAVHKMTGLPAEVFGIADRGVVRTGSIADLVCFDPLAIADHATYEHPHREPTGIRWVMQAGQLTVHHGAWLGRRLGRRLTRSP